MSFLSRISRHPMAINLVAGSAAFLAYASMYAFRKPFTAAAFEGMHVAGFDYKVWLVIAQVMGYMLSKVRGITWIAEIQRQFRDLAQYRKYYSKSHISWTEDEFAEVVKRRTEQQAAYSGKHENIVLAMARGRDIVLASHDDTDARQVDHAKRIGVTISEFPTTQEAADAARAHGLTTVMGAPNVVRGGSHSGNVAALDLARTDSLDMLSSDYVPASLLHGAFMLHTLAGWSMPRAMATVSRNPAKALGFDDRGSLKAGMRADVVRMRDVGGMPIVRHVWVNGQRSF